MRLGSRRRAIRGGGIRSCCRTAPGETGGILVGLRTSASLPPARSSFEPFAPEFATAPDERLARRGVLPNGSFAFATRLRGLLIVDRQRPAAAIRSIGRPACRTTTSTPSWPTVRAALARVANGRESSRGRSPFSVFDEASGLEQEWRQVVKHEGSLYVRGYAGLFEASAPSAERARHGRLGTLQFHRVPASKARPVAAAGRRPPARLVGERHRRDPGKRPRRAISYRSTPMTMYRSRTDPRRVVRRARRGPGLAASRR